MEKARFCVVNNSVQNKISLFNSREMGVFHLFVEENNYFMIKDDSERHV